MSKLIYRFVRRKISFFIIPSIIVSVIFILYQLKIFYELSSPNAIIHLKERTVRGIHPQEQRFYVPRDGYFTCIKSGETIDFKRVNDNYCDCDDSTDEPGTNACPDGIFYCTQISSNKKYPKMVPSSKVNDGICDCCDGSEELNNNVIIKNFPRDFQRNSHHFLVPCPNMCE